MLGDVTTQVSRDLVATSPSHRHGQGSQYVLAAAQWWKVERIEDNVCMSVWHGAYPQQKMFGTRIVMSQLRCSGSGSSRQLREHRIWFDASRHRGINRCRIDRVIAKNVRSDTARLKEDSEQYVRCALFVVRKHRRASRSPVRSPRQPLRDL